MFFLQMALYVAFGITLSANGISFNNGAYWLLLAILSAVDFISYFRGRK